MKRALALALACAFFALPRVTSAEPDEAARAFEAGRRLFESGDCPGAIAKFEESLHLRESVGAHASIAECQEKDAPREAWREFKRAERVAHDRHDDREAALRDRAEALLTGMTRLSLSLPRDVPGLRVVIDGEDMTEFADGGDACPLVPDAGHDVEVSAPSKKTWTHHAQGKAGETLTATAVLEDTTSLPPPPRVPRPQPDRVPAASAPPTASDGGATQRALGIATGAAGVAGLVTGGVFGLVASSKASQVKSDCGGVYPACGPNAVPSTVRDENDQANRFATASTVLTLIGAALVTGGILLYFTAPSSTGTGMVVAPAVSASGGALVIRRSW